MDVRDVAAAHVLAALTPTASGRYVTVAESPVDFMQLANEIGKVYSNYKLPTRYAPTWLIRLFGGLLGITADMRNHMIGMQPPLHDTSCRVAFAHRITQARTRGLTTPRSSRSFR